MLNKFNKLESLSNKKPTPITSEFNPIRYFTGLPIALQHSLYYASALIFAKALGFIMVPFATHYLSLADYGRLDVLQTLADLMSIVIAMGLTETLYRYASTNAEIANNSRKNNSAAINQHQAAANIFGLTLLIASMTLILSQIFAGHISLWLPGDVSLLDVRLILASISLGGLIIVPLSWFRIKDKARQFFIASCVLALLQVGFSVLFLLLGYGVSGVLCATLLAISLLSSYLLKIQLADTGIAFKLGLFQRYARYGGPLVFVGIAGFVLGSFDRWILAASIGTASMASYALACKFGLLTAVLIQPFDLWWHAKRFAVLKLAGGAKLCAKYSSIGIVIALFSALLMSAMGPILVRFLSPIEYHGAVNYIPYLAILAALHSINNSLNLGILSGESTWAVAAIDAAAALLALLGYLIFIPLYQAWGAILATAIALVLRLLLSYKTSQQCLSIPYPTTALIIQGAATCTAIHLLPVATLSLYHLFIYVTASILLLASALKLALIPDFLSSE